LPECPLLVGGVERHLTELPGEGFTLLVGSLPGPLPAALVENVLALKLEDWRVSLVLVTDRPEGSFSVPAELACLEAQDARGRFRLLYDAHPTAIYLVRPDGHVCARWRALRDGDLAAALRTAMGSPERVH
jgi:3-(3-hydroxy-phenyl)propionate hydroxylase